MSLPDFVLPLKSDRRDFQKMMMRSQHQIRGPIQLLTAAVLTLLGGCGAGVVGTPVAPVSSVTPSVTGTPNSIAAWGNFEFVSVQQAGQIFTYDLSTGAQVLAGAPYAMPCNDPSGMVVTTVGSATVMAAVCFDTGQLVTLTVHADGTLTALGVVGGLVNPYPGIALDGTNVMVPLFGVSNASNGAVAKVSIAQPDKPMVTGMATLANPAAGGFANPSALTVWQGTVFVAAGSESVPLDQTSTVQALDEGSMTLLGPPLVVAHSPQRVLVLGGVLYATFFDAEQMESIDVSIPSRMKPLEVLPLTAGAGGCDALGLAGSGTTAYVGCYGQGVVESIDVTMPANMQLVASVVSVGHPQGMVLANQFLLSTDSVTGGAVYMVNVPQVLSGKV